MSAHSRLPGFGVFCLTLLLWQLQFAYKLHHQTSATTSATAHVGWIPELHQVSKKGELSSKNESFSACLLTMDDNHWLIEWLAYHYHVLPLYSLVVVRDPQSKTTSQAILERWKNRIHIREWNDARILPAWVLRKWRAGNISTVSLHRYRQQFFYAACMKDFQRRNQTWILLSDVDEFVRPNPYLNGTTTTPPPLSQPGSVLVTLQQHGLERQLVNDKPPLQCIHVPRIQMATKEDQQDTQHSSILPLKSWNASHFLTTRWLHHNGHEIRGPKNLNGKNVVNVQTIQKADIPRKVPNVHTVLPDICPATVGDRLYHTDSPLVIHHYAGSLEQFRYRQDPRDQVAGRPHRTDPNVWSAIGQTVSSPASIKDDSTTAWLPGFVASVGAKEAARLLDGVGVVGIE